MDLILPIEYYQIPNGGELVFDDLGFRIYCEDLVKYEGVGDMDGERIVVSFVLRNGKTHVWSEL